MEPTPTPLPYVKQFAKRIQKYAQRLDISLALTYYWTIQ